MNLNNKLFKAILSIAFLFVFMGAFTPAAQALTEAQIQAILNLLTSFGADSSVVANVEISLRGETSIVPEPVAWCYTFSQGLKVDDAGSEVKALQTALQKEGLYDRTITGSFDAYTFSAVVAFQEKYASEVLTQWGLSRGTGYIGPSTRAKLNALYGCDVATPLVTVISPNGGETWAVGETQIVEWKSSSEIQWVTIALWASNDPQVDATTDYNARAITKGVEYAPRGYFRWTVNPDEIGIDFSQYKYYKVSIDGYVEEPEGLPGQFTTRDVSDNYFSIVESTTDNLPPVIDGLTAPSQLSVNETGTWTVKAHDPENGTLSYSVDWGDTKLSPLSASETGTQTTTFTHSYTQTGTYKVKFTVTDDHNQAAETSATVKVVAVDCHGSALWSWDYCSYLCKCDAGEGDCDDDNECNTGYCAQNVGEKYGQSTSMDVCEEKSSISSITVLSPNGGETWVKGQNHQIKWSSENVDSVMITISNASYTGISSGGTITVTDLPISASSGYYNWTIRSLPLGDRTDMYKINIAEVFTTETSPGAYSFEYGVSDRSDDYFSIVEPGLSGELTLVKALTYGDQIMSAPLYDAKLGHYILSADSVEDITINEIRIDFIDGGGNTTFDGSDHISNAYFAYVDQTSAVKTSVADTNNVWFINYNLSAGKTIDIAVYGDVSSYASNSVFYTAMQVTGTTASGETVYGVGSSATNELAGQRITLANGTLTAEKSSNSPENQVVAGNQTITSVIYKFTSRYDTFTINELKVKLPSGVSKIVNSAILKDGSTVLATKPFSSTGAEANDTAHFTGLNVEVPANTSKELKVDLVLGNPVSDVGSTGLDVQLSLHLMKYQDSAGNVSSDPTPGAGNTIPSGNHIYVYKAYPTFTDNNSSLGDTFTNGVQSTLYQFKVKANNGPVALKQLKFQVVFNDVNIQELELESLKLFRGSTNLTNLVSIQDENANNIEDPTGVLESPDGINEIIISWDLTREEIIPSGSEYTYTLKGTPQGFNSALGSSDSVSIYLKGVASSPDVRNYLTNETWGNSIYQLTSLAGFPTGDDSDLIWSDVSAVVHTAGTTSSNDWHNGYLIKNLNLASKTWSLGGITPSITVLSPNGGETLKVGETYDIKWTASGVTADTIRLELTSTSFYRKKIADVSPSTGVYSWTVTSDFYLSPNEKNKIFAVCYSCSTFLQDESDDYFSIVSPSITVTSPNGGETWTAGNTYNITWDSSGIDKVNVGVLIYDSNYDLVKIAYSLAFEKDNNGYLEWNIPINDPSLSVYPYYKISVVGKTDSNSYADTSDDYFSIVEPAPTCADSDGGKNYYVKGTATGQSTAGPGTFVGVDDCRLNGVRVDFCSGSNCNLFEYYCSGVTYVERDVYTCPYGCEDGACKPGITVTSPNGGETFTRGNTYTVRWESNGIDKVRIYIFNPSISGSGSTNYIIPNNQAISASAGSYSWTVGEVGLPSGVGEGLVYKIRIDDVDSSVSDESDDYFSIVESTPACTDSDGGLNYYVKGSVIQGSAYSTDCCAVNQYSPDCIYSSYYLAERYCTTGGLLDTEIYHCPYGCEDGACKQVITVTSPNGGETWTAGNTYNITWDAADSIDKVDIYLYKSGQQYPSGSALAWGVDASSGKFPYILTSNPPTGSEWQIKIVDSSNSNNFDFSDSYFTIAMTEDLGMQQQDIEDRLASLTDTVNQILNKLKELIGE